MSDPMLATLCLIGSMYFVFMLWGILEFISWMRGRKEQ